MNTFFESIKLSRDILRGVNQTVWGGAAGVEKVSTMVKTGIAGSDACIGVSHAIEDYQCQDMVCFSLDLIGSVSSSIGIVVGNIPATKHLTLVTTPVTIVCRSVRGYCKKYGTMFGCAVSVGVGIKEVAKKIK